MEANQINCSFADVMHSRFLQKRYGINSCKKEIDLNRLRNQKWVNDLETYRDISSPVITDTTFALTCKTPVSKPIVYCVPAIVTPPVIDPDDFPLRVYYGASDVQNIDEATIEASQYITIIDQSDFTLDFSYAVGTPYYLWFAERIAQPRKLHYADTIYTDNQGNIATDQDLYNVPTFVGKYRYYVTEYLTEIVNPFSYKQL